MDTKNVIAAIALSSAVIVLYSLFFAPEKPITNKNLDERKKMVHEMNSAKLIIHTFCGTGHLECFATNRPTVILFLNDTNLFTDNTTFSTSSISTVRQLLINNQTPKLQEFLGREILQEELYDTLHFISHKT